MLVLEKVFATINKTRMGMFIKTQKENAPVLLFVHGGPGMPVYFLDKKYKSGLENEFTVVWWDQRGSGLSYDKNLNKETLTVEQSIEDIIAMQGLYLERKNKPLAGEASACLFGNGENKAVERNRY